MKHYCPKCGAELKEHQLLCPECNLCCVLDGLDDGKNALNSVLSAYQIEVNTQWTKYHTKGATGFAAEDMSSLEDFWKGHDVFQAGRNNEKDGADIITDGQPRQLKYYSSAKATVSSAFDKTTGNYRYGDMPLEVPLDQYEESLEIMRAKIAEGKVPGITNPDDAALLVKKGVVTWKQARNIARAGNIDSLRYDVKNQSVAAASAFGISFAITFGLNCIFAKHNKTSLKEVFALSVLSGLKAGTITLTSGVLSQQFLRTTVGREFAAYFTKISKQGIDFIYKKGGQGFIEKAASTLLGEKLEEHLAKNALVKVLRTNTVTNLGVFVVTSIPDTYRVLIGQISSKQFVKNLVVNASGLGGASLGMLAGSALGPAGLIGGALAGGLVFSWSTKKVADSISKDDAELMQELIRVALVELSNEYMIQSEEEFRNCIKAITVEKAIDTNLLRLMYSIGAEHDNDELRVEIAKEKLEYYFQTTIRSRKTFLLTQGENKMLNHPEN